MKKVLIISGRRTFNNYDYFKDIIDPVINDVDTMIFGEAKGVDSLALKYAKENNIKYKMFVADWDKYDNAAGPIRNYELIKYAKENFDKQYLYAFVNDDSKGTKDCIDKALKNDIIVRIIKIPRG